MKSQLNIMENIEAAWFDIDGTLKADHQEPTELMMAAWGRIPLRGINSARNIRSAEKVIPPSSLTVPSIALTGGEVWEPGGGLIKSFPIPSAEKAALALWIALEASLKAALFYPEGRRQKVVYASNPEVARYYHGRDWEPQDSMTSSREIFARWLERIATTKVVLKFPKAGVPAPPRDLAERLSLERPSDESLAVTGWRVNKGTTLLWLCDSLNIDPAKVLTAGDTEADSEAFRHTRGIAVGTQVLPHSRHRVENPAALAMLLAQEGDLESKSMATAAAC